jgi:ABC-type Mn2+/Zn2+ transport system ATPase subunit
VKQAVELNKLGIRYGKRFALQAVDLNVAEGEALGIIGTNGSGKSTLLKAVAGLLKPATGSVRVFSQCPRKNAPGTIAYVPQIEHVDWTFPATVRDVVAMGRFCRIPFYRVFSQDDRRIVEESLAALGMADLASRHISALSGGQQQRVFLARALAQQPQVLLLDEPTTGVDAETEEALRLLVRHLVSEGRTVLMSTHDLDRVTDWFDRVILVNRVIVAQGAPSEILAQGHNVVPDHGHGHSRSHPHD